MRIYYTFFALLLLVTVSSCNITRKIFGKEKAGIERPSEGRSGVVMKKSDARNVPAAVENDVRENLPRNSYTDKVLYYIDTYAPIAQEEMRNYKIPASITLAQGILESGAGEGELTRKANNHFGIKCHGWKGGQVFHDDDRRQECFRKYKDAKYSFRDHSLFLTERKRYAALFDLQPDDYEGWAKGLKAAGYATDRAYPTKLISLIERYALYRYDAEVLGTPVAGNETKRGEVERHIVQKGDTLYSIAKRYNTSVEQLQKSNNLTGSTISIGQTLYVTPL